MSLYNLRSLTPDSYMIAKFDSDFNVESTYTLTASRNGHFDCDCPAGSRSVVTKPCRHRLMLPALLPAVDTDRFYDFDTKKFCEPLGNLADLRAEVDHSQLDIEGVIEQGIMDNLDLTRDQVIDKLEASGAFVGEAIRNDTKDFIAVGPDLLGQTFKGEVITQFAPVVPQAPTIRRR